MHTAEQLPVEGSKVVGDVLRLPSVDLCVSRGDLDLLGEGHLVAGRDMGWASEFLLPAPLSLPSQPRLVKEFLPGPHSCLGYRQTGDC